MKGKMRANLFSETVRKAAKATRESYNTSLINIILRLIFILVLGYTYYTLFGMSFEGVFTKIWGTIFSVIWFFLIIPLLYFFVQLLVQPGKIYKELLANTSVLENRDDNEILNIHVGYKTYMHDKKYSHLNLFIDNFESDDITECFIELRAIDNGKEKFILDFPIRLRWVEKKITFPKESMNTIKRGERKLLEAMHVNVKSEYLAISTKDSGEYQNEIGSIFYLDLAIFGKVGGVSRFPNLLRIQVEFIEQEFVVKFLEVK